MALEDKQTNWQNKINSATADLESAKAKNEAILASIADGLVVTDQEGNIVRVNNSFEQMLGWKWDEVQNKKFVEVVPLLGENGQTVVESERLITKALKQKTTITIITDSSLHYKRHDGTIFPVSISVSPVILDGAIVGAVEIFRDVSSQVRVVADLEKAKKAMLNVLEDVQQEKAKALTLARDLEKYKIALDGTSDHVIITDPNGMILYANASIERITGFSPHEVVGKKAGTRELWGGNMGQSFYEELWHTIKVELKPFTGQIKNKRKSGEFYEALTSISPILDKSGNLEFFVGIERDITKEKEVDRMKTEFISLASHQLRTPLTAIKWLLEMVLSGDSGQLTAKQKKYLKDVDSSNERMIDLVNTLLNISRIESGRLTINPKPTNLEKLIRDLVMQFQSKIEEKKLDFIISVNPNLREINIDPKLIYEVYSNLISNAIKYTPIGGKITVFVSEKDGEAVSQVTDSGYGIPKKDQTRVFQKFFRSENIVSIVTDGTGLGLYLAKIIIDSSGGKIWFESEEGKGTTFSFSLPISGVAAKKGEVSLDS